MSKHVLCLPTMPDVGGYDDEWNPLSIVVPLDLARLEWLLSRAEQHRAWQRELDSESEPPQHLQEIIYTDWTPLYFNDFVPDDDPPFRVGGGPEMGDCEPMVYSWLCFVGGEIWWKALHKFHDMPVRSEPMFVHELHRIRCCLVPASQMGEALLGLATWSPNAALDGTCQRL